MKEMTHDFLYGTDFDFPPRDGPPEKTVALMFIPRSGSNLLACLMAQTKNLGFPLEYFSPRNMEMMSERMSDLGAENIEPILRSRTSPNGVFAFKWNGDFAGLPHGPAVYAALSPSALIVVDREDHEAQARSLASAIKTQEWVVRRGNSRTDVTPSAKEIATAKKALRRHRKDIERMVKKPQSEVLRVTYEQMLADAQKCVDGVATFVGVDSGAVDIGNVPIGKIAR